MADNYLGRKMEEYLSRNRSEKEHHKSITTLHGLMEKIRHDNFDTGFQIREDQLKRIVAINASVKFSQETSVLAYQCITAEEAQKIKACEALLHGQACIIVGSTAAENRQVDLDLGLSVQSMLLQAAEIGLTGNWTAEFDRQAIREHFHLEFEPLLLVFIGKSAK